MGSRYCLPGGMCHHQVISGVVVPRVLDYEAWRNHASAFFHRLCAHRRAMHGRWNKAMAEFSRRQGTAAEKILELESRLAAVEARLASVSSPSRQSARSPQRHDRSSPTQRGRPPTADQQHHTTTLAGSRERSIPERILDAQLEAIGRRSDSLGPDALRALEAFRQVHGPPFPPSDLSGALARCSSDGAPSKWFVGKIKSYSEENGYGFIECSQTFAHYGKDVYVRRAQIGNLAVGVLVTFTCDTSPQGMPQASNIQPTTD